VLSVLSVLSVLLVLSVLSVLHTHCTMLPVDSAIKQPLK
jgi:hypothetical protein